MISRLRFAPRVLGARLHRFRAVLAVLVWLALQARVFYSALRAVRLVLLNLANPAIATTVNIGQALRARLAPLENIVQLALLVALQAVPLEPIATVSNARMDQ